MIKKIKSRLDGHDAEIETNRTQIVGLGSRLDSHDTKIEKNWKQIATLDDRLNDHDTEIETHRTQIVELGSRLDSHDTKIEKNREQIAKLDDRLNDHGTEIETNRTQIEKLGIRIEVVEASTAHLNVCTGIDSSDIQDELNKLKETGGIVTLLPKEYIINEPISIPPFVTLEGTFRSPPSVFKKGTEFVVNIEGGNATGTPLITLAGRNSTIKGVRIFYAKQKFVTDDGGFIVDVTPFPWTISSESDDVCIQDVCLLNSYQGVHFSVKPVAPSVDLDRNGRQLIKGLNGTPLKTGIRIDQSLDTIRIEDVHFWPFLNTTAYDEPGGTIRYTLEHGTALELVGSDWTIVHNFLAYGYRVGIMFLKGNDHPIHKDWATNGQFSNINIDFAKIGIDFHNTSHVGAHFSNLNIAASPLGEYAIYGRPSTDPNERTGKLQISGASFWGPWPSEMIKWETNGLLMISSSIFDKWLLFHPAIKLLAGRAMIQNNYFTDERYDFERSEENNQIARESVRIEASAERVIVTGNQLTGNPINVIDSDLAHLRVIENNSDE